MCTTLTHVKTAAPRTAITWKSRSSLNLENLSAIFRTQQQLLCQFRRCPRQARATTACTRPTSPPACGWQADVYIRFTIHLITFPPQYGHKQPYLTDTKRQCYSPFQRQSRPRGSVLYYCGAVCAFTLANYELFYKLCCTRGMFYHIKCLHWLDKTRIIWAVSGFDCLY